MGPVLPPGKLAKVQQTLSRLALTFPESHEDHPWDHVAIKVRGKIFVIFGGTKDRFSMTCKLPVSGRGMLLLPFTEPSSHGMGKHGWVTANFERGAEPPVPILMDWIEESFRAVAPKALVKQLDTEESGPEKNKSATKKKPAAKKRAASP